MAFRVFESADQGASFVIILVTLPICVLVTVLRFIVIIRSSARKIAVEDWMVVGALWIYLAWAIYELILIVNVTNGNKNLFVPTEFDPKVWRDSIITGYVVQILFGIQQTLAKLSLLIFYYRIFSVHKTFVRLSYIVGTIQIMYCITWIFTSIFECNPPRKFWDPTVPGRCIDPSITLAVCESINSLIDFIMVGMAIYIVRRLEMSRSNKLKLSVLFAFGGFTGLLGFVRIGMAYGTIGASDHTLVYMILQMASSIICCCLPIYRAVMLEIPGLRWLQSKLHKSRDSGNYGTGGPSSFKTIGQKSSRERKTKKTAEWLPLDELNSAHNLSTTAWAGTERERGNGRDLPSNSTRTVEVQQMVEVV